MDEAEGLQAAARGFEFGKTAAFLLDQVILDSADAFGRFKNIFPRGDTFSEQHGVTFARFRRPILEMERPDSAGIRANPRDGIRARLDTRADVKLQHDG